MESLSKKQRDKSGGCPHEITGFLWTAGRTKNSGVHDAGTGRGVIDTAASRNQRRECTIGACARKSKNPPGQEKGLATAGALAPTLNIGP